MGRKVLFTASTYSHIVNFHLPYLRRFQEEGWTVHAACGAAPMDIPYADEVFEFPLEKSMWSPNNFRAAIALSDKLRREGYDLISTHTSLAAFFTRLALWGLEDRPLVSNMVHGYLFDGDTPWLKRNLLLTAERWMARSTDLVLTMNRWDYEAAEWFGLGRSVSQIPGVGVDFSRLDNVPPDARQRLRTQWGIPGDVFVLLYPAEFSARKSQGVLIRAMGRLPDNVYLVLAGEGGLRGGCQALARELGVTDRVLFPGHIRNMGAWYAAADAAVSASRIEGLPFNIMEAMYAGLPVVASDVKGHSDLISDGETGLLYPYGNVNACAGRVSELMGSAGLRRWLGGNARARVERYRLEEVFPIVWDEYARLSASGAYAQRNQTR